MAHDMAKLAAMQYMIIAAVSLAGIGAIIWFLVWQFQSASAN